MNCLCQCRRGGTVWICRNGIRKWTRIPKRATIWWRLDRIWNQCRSPLVLSKRIKGWRGLGVEPAAKQICIINIIIIIINPDWNKNKYKILIWIKLWKEIESRWKQRNSTVTLTTNMWRSTLMGGDSRKSETLGIQSWKTYSGRLLLGNVTELIAIGIGIGRAVLPTLGSQT